MTKQLPSFYKLPLTLWTPVHSNTFPMIPWFRKFPFFSRNCFQDFISYLLSVLLPPSKFRLYLDFAAPAYSHLIPSSSPSFAKSSVSSKLAINCPTQQHLSIFKLLTLASQPPHISFPWYVIMPEADWVIWRSYIPLPSPPLLFKASKLFLNRKIVSLICINRKCIYQERQSKTPSISIPSLPLTNLRRLQSASSFCP